MASWATGYILFDIINPGIILHVPNPYYYGCVTENPRRQNAPCNSLHASAQYRQVSASSLSENIEILWRKH